MTDQEAAALAKGARVLYAARTRSGLYREGTIEQVIPARGAFRLRLRVRPAGFDALLRVRVPVSRYAHEVSHPSPPDTLSANVYADFLDEAGEPAAAAKLRSAFPLDGGAGGGGS